MFKSKKSGLTMIEIILALAILAIISIIVLVGLNNYRTREVLRADALLVSSVLRQARSQTVAGTGDSVYGVHFDEDQVVLFVGGNYDANRPSNSTSTLNNLVRLATSSLNANEIIFSKLSGTPNVTGNVILFLDNNPTASTTVSINDLGVVGN